ncbi:hypothetical protein EYF80_013347 [Liparis tanakae]|uniref:Uncharacterized protein n=1 Tax=Liparis tanakae TaxID=230148 RepID=A0A4Z2IGN5_9TELE|nr:hypothetical protein EYF80_013347 [Liparis tanakae]
MSLHDIIGKTQSETKETSAPDNMAEGAQIDGMLEEISDAVFKKLSSSLDIKLQQIATSVNSTASKQG